MTAFDHIERDVGGHFRLNLYAAIYRVVDGLRRLGPGGSDLERSLREHQFLKRYVEEMLPHMPAELAWDSMWRGWQAEIRAWEQGHNLPLAALAREGILSFTGRLALMIVALAEEDSRFGTLFDALQKPLVSRRPTVELVGHILRDDAASDGWEICRPLLGVGLIEVLPPAAPPSEWALKLPAPVWAMIRGGEERDLVPGCQTSPATAFPAIDDLVLDDDLRARLTRVPALIADRTVRTLVVRGMPGSDQLQAIGAVARALDRGVAAVNANPQNKNDGGGQPARPLFGRLCVMGGYLPVFIYDLGPGETIELPSLPGYSGPIGIVLGMEGGRRSATAGGTLTLTLPPLSADQRRQCWRGTLGAFASIDLAHISERFVLPAGHIRQAAELATRHAALDRRDSIVVADIREACATLNRQMLDAHAARLEGSGAWHQAGGSEATAVRLRDLELRCRHRERLLEHIGNGFTGCNRGVRALLTGASGTGKTLAAKILAAELGMDIYRVDLGAVVNKYIGETEKNLHQVLSRAEALDVILLLDEGDSLLGSRTDIKSANDRYANLETNYLLQRLETYQGIVVVADA